MERYAAGTSAGETTGGLRECRARFTDGGSGQPHEMVRTRSGIAGRAWPSSLEFSASEAGRIRPECLLGLVVDRARKTKHGSYRHKEESCSWPNRPPYSGRRRPPDRAVDKALPARRKYRRTFGAKRWGARRSRRHEIACVPAPSAPRYHRSRRRAGKQSRRAAAAPCCLPPMDRPAPCSQCR